MQTIEFECHLKNGLIQVPKHYQNWFQKSVKVRLLATDKIAKKPQKDSINEEVKNFFENIQIDLSGYHFNRDEANER
jgi:hypothetical protein